MLKALLIRIFVSTVLFTGICLFVSYYLNKTELQNEITDLDLRQKTGLVASYLDSKERYEDSLEIMGLYFAEKLQNNKSLDIKKTQSLLAKTANIYGYVEAFVALADGKTIASSGYSMNALELKRPWFMEIINGKNYYQSEFYQSMTGKKVITFSMPIKVNNKIIGVAGIDIDGKNFISSNSEYVLANKHGVVFFTDPVNTDFLDEDIYKIRPSHINSSEKPLIYTNPSGDYYSVSKIVLDDGNLLFSMIALNKSIDKNYRVIRDIVAVVFVLFLIIMSVIFFVLSRELKVIKNISKQVKHISKGYLENISINSRYEFSYVSKVINELAQKLSSVISKSQMVMRDIKTKQTLAAELVEQNRTNFLNELSFVEEVKSASSELASAATEVASNAAEAEKATIEANTVIDSSQSILTNATKASEKINTSFVEAKNTVNQLRDHSKKISTVVDVIENISEQTNLLALNAAIEAARAGSQGRGFAVVADEVRALAAKTQKSTIDIQNIISQLQDKSKQANDSMNQNVELVRVTQNSMDELKHSFDIISNKVTGISQINAIVAAASEEQNVVTQDISKQLENMNSLVQQNLKAVEQSSRSNQKVSDLASLLESELSFFKVRK